MLSGFLHGEKKQYRKGTAAGFICNTGLRETSCLRSSREGRKACPCRLPQDPQAFRCRGGGKGKRAFSAERRCGVREAPPRTGSRNNSCVSSGEFRRSSRRDRDNCTCTYPLLYTWLPAPSGYRRKPVLSL